MGVPFFFRWLVRRYSQILSTAKTGCDYFYLDFNGILHTFFHPDDGSVPANFEEVLLGVCAALDSLVALIQPQKFLFIALDGVAPRAKLNHQRGRRFRSANEKENDEKNPLSEPSFLGSNAITPGTTFMAFAGTYLAQHIAEKIKADADWAKIKILLSDSNSPGEGEHKIIQFIRAQIQSPDYDPKTRHVLYGSDADLIMLGLSLHVPNVTILRDLPAKKGYNPRRPKPRAKPKRAENVMYIGNLPQSIKDAPSLLSKLPASCQKAIQSQFYTNQARKYVFLEFQNSDEAAKCCLELSGFVIDGKILKVDRPLHLPEDFHLKIKPIETTNLSGSLGFLSVDVLRQCILKECSNFKKAITNFELNIESIIDDFVFLTMLVGNDFLPEIPGIAIWNDVFETVINLYFKKIFSYSGYLTHCGKLNEPALGAFFCDLAMIEERIFKRNWAIDEKKRWSKLSPERKKEELDRANPFREQSIPRAHEEPNKDIAEQQKSVVEIVKESTQVESKVMEEQVVDDEEDKPKKIGKGDVEVEPLMNEPKSFKDVSSYADVLEAENEIFDFKEDSVPKLKGQGIKLIHSTNKLKLHLSGYKERYCQTYFPNVAIENVCQKYFTVLEWNLGYYTQLLPSWEEFYPFHYAPLLSDLARFLVETTPKKTPIDATLPLHSTGFPYLPFQQLLAVLPRSSSDCIPESLRPLMLAPKSPIASFYPTAFEVDLNGPFAWNGIVLLDFIDEKKLFEAYASFTKDIMWSKDELARNCNADSDLLFCPEDLMKDQSEAFLSFGTTGVRGSVVKDPKWEFSDANHPDQEEEEDFGFQSKTFYCYQFKLPPLFLASHVKAIDFFSKADVQQQDQQDGAILNEWIKFQRSSVQISKKPFKLNKKKGKRWQQDKKKFTGKAQSLVEVVTHRDLTNHILEESPVGNSPTPMHEKPVVDLTQPTTKLSLRTSNGKTVVIVMNRSHSVAQLKQMIFIEVGSSNRSFKIATVHPFVILGEELDNKTLEEQGLLNVSLRIVN